MDINLVRTTYGQEDQSLCFITCTISHYCMVFGQFMSYHTKTQKRSCHLSYATIVHPILVWKCLSVFHVTFIFYL